MKIPIKVYEELKPNTPLSFFKNKVGQIVREADRVYLVTTI